MAERAAAMGGDFDAGPLPAGGWRVHGRPAGRGRLRSLSVANDPLRVVIADDQELFRAGFRLILEAHGIEVVGEVTDGLDSVEPARRFRPNVCLADIRMPRLDGLEVTRILAGPDVDDRSRSSS